ncbi:MAG: hypothetical protein IJ992_07565 [Lentisphaeria bacterium]|nr:hypothetical protein [Lentisphaeria bacterium]
MFFAPALFFVRAGCPSVSRSTLPACTKKAEPSGFRRMAQDRRLRCVTVFLPLPSGKVLFFQSEIQFSTQENRYSASRLLLSVDFFLNRAIFIV